jgi:hypothetical protein
MASHEVSQGVGERAVLGVVGSGEPREEVTRLARNSVTVNVRVDTVSIKSLKSDLNKKMLCIDTVVRRVWLKMRLLKMRYVF